MAGNEASELFVVREDRRWVRVDEATGSFWGLGLNNLGLTGIGCHLFRVSRGLCLVFIGFGVSRGEG